MLQLATLLHTLHRLLSLRPILLATSHSQGDCKPTVLRFLVQSPAISHLMTYNNHAGPRPDRSLALEQLRYGYDGASREPR